MRRSILISAIALLIVGVGVAEHRSQAMTFDTGRRPQAMRVADVVQGVEGIQTWTKLMELGGIDGYKSPQTLFVPSDAAFSAIPTSELKELLSPDSGDLRRAFLARGATDSRLSPTQISGRRISVNTLDGRPLTIDATGEEVMVGDAEVLDIRTLPDGKVMFVIDHALVR